MARYFKVTSILGVVTLLNPVFIAGENNVSEAFTTAAQDIGTLATTVPFSTCGNKGLNTVAIDAIGDIPAGTHNAIESGHLVIVAGGEANTASGDFVSIAGGDSNSVEGRCSTLLGGHNGVGKGMYIAHGGGSSNQVWSNYASVSGGYKNVISGRFSSVVGSGGNRVQAHHSLVVGSTSRIVADYSAAFGFGTEECYVGYPNTIELCATSLYLNDEEVDLDGLNARARLLLEAGEIEGTDNEAMVEDLEQLLKMLEDISEHQDRRLQAVTERILQTHE